MAFIMSSDNGNVLKMHDLSGACVFTSHSFGQGQMYLYDDGEEKKIKDEKKCDNVVEISVSSLRSCEGSATCLVARLESGLHLIYQFVWRSTKDSSRILLLRRLRGAAFDRYTKSRQNNNNNNRTSILPFYDVILDDATYSCDGIFCTGTTSPFFLSLQRGRVVATKMLCRLDDEDSNENTTSLVSFHTSFVNRGFILCKTSSPSSSSLEICSFDAIQSNRRATLFGETCGLDGSVNVRHVCLNSTVSCQKFSHWREEEKQTKQSLLLSFSFSSKTEFTFVTNLGTQDFVSR